MKKLLILAAFLLSWALAQPLLPDIYLKKEVSQGTLCLINTSFYNPWSYDIQAYSRNLVLPPSPDGLEYLDLGKLKSLELIMVQKMDLVAQDKECNFVTFTQHPAEFIEDYQGVSSSEVLAYRKMLYHLAQERNLKILTPNSEAEGYTS